MIGIDSKGNCGAFANRCPHIGTPLDQGYVNEQGQVVCPLHGSTFDLKTGKVDKWCPSPPVIGPITGALKGPRDLAVFQARK